MRSYSNTFRHRTSDQHDDDGHTKFLRSFAPDVVDLLPAERWDQLLIIRSAPGAGKTSLLRAFEPRTLQTVCGDRDGYPALWECLNDAGAIVTGRPRALGARVSMRAYFQDLVDLRLGDSGANKLFFRFLDSQILSAFLLAIVRLFRLDTVNDLYRVELNPLESDPIWPQRLGGTRGHDLWSWAKSTEDASRTLLDSVLPIANDRLNGHSELYSLNALGGCSIVVDGRGQDLRPLLMIDDGQWLDPSQRRSLLDSLVDRHISIGRWYTERHQALSSDEIIGDGEPTRRYCVLDLEEATRAMGRRDTGKPRVRRFETILMDVANRRASRPLREHGDDSESSFATYLENDSAAVSDASRLVKAIETVRGRVTDLTLNRPRFEGWIRDTPQETTLQTAVYWRELEVLIRRDLSRRQLQLLELELNETERLRRTSSAIRDAAWIFLHKEFKIPYYYSSERVAKLGDHNFDQFLRICGDLFDEMLTSLILGHRPSLSIDAQQRMLLEVSRQVWREIPLRRSYGRDIQIILTQIAKLAQSHTYRPTAPYAPGVTGIGLSMYERSLLLDPKYRERTPGAPALFNAIGGAVGHNLLNASRDRRAKNDEWLVLYLNRLLCVRYKLPVGRGGWYPMRLRNLCAWLTEPAKTDLRGAPLQDQLLDEFS